MSEIKGFITKVIFEGDNNYKIFQINRKVTVKGRLFFDIFEGLEVICEGEFLDQNSFELFRCYKYEIKEKEVIVKILESGKVKGVGPYLAKKIVDSFDIDTFYIIERKPNELEKIEGISKSKIKEIRNSWNKIKSAKDTIVSLIKIGYEIDVCFCLYDKYGSRTINEINRNPYIPLQFNKVNFNHIDDIAIYKMKIEPLSSLRISESINFFLSGLHQKTGNTIVKLDLLIKKTIKSLNLESKYVVKEINRLKNNKKIFIYKIEKEKYVQTDTYRKAEKYVALRLKGSLSENNNNINVNIKNDLTGFYEKFNSGNITLIFGDNGTGKTTFLKEFVEMIKSEYTYELVTFSGSILNDIKINFDLNFTTIHKLLEYDFKKEKFFYGEKNKIERDVFIIEDVSSIDIILFESLLRAIPETSKIIVVGGKNKLPSVGAGNILNDLLVIKKDRIVLFDKVFKKKDSSIMVKNNNNLGYLFKDENVSIIKSASEQELWGNIYDFIKNKNFNIEDFHIISPINNGDVGVNSLNRMVKSIYNPQKYKSEKVLIDIGDKVIQIKNNYDKGIYTGEFGLIEGKDDFEYKIRFKNKSVVYYNKEDMLGVALGYSSTIHRAQNAKIKNLLFVVPENNLFLNYEMIKVALATGYEKIFVFGSMSDISRALKNKNKLKRLTLLRNFMK